MQTRKRRREEDDFEGGPAEAEAEDEDEDEEGDRMLQEEEEEEEEAEDANEAGEEPGPGEQGRSFECSYSGHCNVQTVKSVNFFGPEVLLLLFSLLLLPRTLVRLSH